MGIISSKLLKSDSKPVKVSAAIQTETPKQSKEIPDVRSPTAEIIRTPIIVEKLKSEINCPDECQPFPLKNKLLKSLKSDPRSPTIGIYRTPILIEETPEKSTPDNCDSPISIYSCNVNGSVVEDLMTPIESSMNVSGFEVPKAVYFDETEISLKYKETAEKEENKSCLKVSDRPNTYEAKKLLEEIISDEENFLKKVKMPSKKSKKTPKTTQKALTDTKPKLRPPLSNITSSTNSPGNINTGVRLSGKNKVFPEFGSENSVTPNAKYAVQWDQNNTVVI